MLAFLDRLFGCSRESVKNKKRRDGLEPTEVEEVLIDSVSFLLQRHAHINPSFI